jgi:AraC-like DNA-binding protein
MSRNVTGVRPLYDISGDTSCFYVRQKGRFAGQAVILDVEMTGLDYVRTAERVRHDGVDFLWLEYTRSGGQGSVETPDGLFETPDHTVFICDQGRPTHRRVYNANFLGVRLDRSLFTPSQIEDLCGRLIDGAKARLIGDFLRALSNAATLAPVTEASIAAVVAATVSNSADRAQEVAAALGPVALDRARRYIDAHLGREGVSMDEVVAVTGVSRATLYRLFAPYGGLARFMWSRRLDAVRRSICNPAERRSLNVLAQTHGFSDAAHFTRAFKTEFGVRPSDLRPFLSA